MPVAAEKQHCLRGLKLRDIWIKGCLYTSLTTKGGELAKCQRYYMSLFSKLVNEATKGRGGVKNPQNFVNVVYGCPLGLNKLLCFCVVVTPCIQSYCKKVFSLGAFCSGKKGQEQVGGLLGIFCQHGVYKNDISILIMNEADAPNYIQFPDVFYCVCPAPWMIFFIHLKFLHIHLGNQKIQLTSLYG